MRKITKEKLEERIQRVVSNLEDKKTESFSPAKHLAIDKYNKRLANLYLLIGDYRQSLMYKAKTQIKQPATYHSNGEIKTPAQTELERFYNSKNIKE